MLHRSGPHTSMRCVYNEVVMLVQFCVLRVQNGNGVECLARAKCVVVIVQLSVLRVQLLFLTAYSKSVVIFNACEI